MIQCLIFYKCVKSIKNEMKKIKFIFLLSYRLFKRKIAMQTINQMIVFYLSATIENDFAYYSCWYIQHSGRRQIAACVYAVSKSSMNPKQSHCLFACLLFQLVRKTNDAKRAHFRRRCYYRSHSAAGQIIQSSKSNEL